VKNRVMSGVKRRTTSAGANGRKDGTRGMTERNGESGRGMELGETRRRGWDGRINILKWLMGCPHRGSVD
jgi:hypothetical protein